MGTISTESYTPKNIGDAIRFRIPLYQRPYAWEEPQVLQLLVDLKLQFEKDKNEEYYIGILSLGKTDADENRYDLIDGQQRITTLLLIGRFLSKKYPGSQWSTFIEKRMELYGREEDQKYLNYLNSVSAPNPKMVSAIKIIEEFVKVIEIEASISEAELFSKYIYEKAAFFISEVPDDYTIIEKNLQFVRMNNRGKQLELHDILKIKLAFILGKDKRANFIKEWNRFSQMGCAPEKASDYPDKKKLIDILKEPYLEVVPKESEIFYQSIVSFPEFLLIAFSRFNYGDDNEPKVNVSNRKDKLLEEFGFVENKLVINWNESKVEKFFELLKNQFELFDRFFIKRDKDEAYKFKMVDNIDEAKKSFKSNEGEQIEKLKVFQSYLFVSREAHVWLKDAFSFLELSGKVPEEIDALEFLKFLKERDDNSRKGKDFDKNALYYPEIDRYWFWRLDYYLWEAEVENPQKTLESEAIEKYAFRANRSIEHLHPQSKEEDWKGSLHSFGNLAMISSGFNSTQSNDPEKIKFARIKDQIDKKKLESIKMLKMYQIAGANNENWTEGLAKEHNDEMINILVNTFKDHINYQDIRDKLITQKSGM
jgi:uncharacterized protein with ParB-like and HNH nuclease domain